MNLSILLEENWKKNTESIFLKSVTGIE